MCTGSDARSSGPKRMKCKRNQMSRIPREKSYKGINALLSIISLKTSNSTLYPSSYPSSKTPRISPSNSQVLGQ
jgi:hypothetical protein